MRFSIKAAVLDLGIASKKTKLYHATAERLLKKSEKYVPKDTGKLANSGRVEGTKIIYDTPYARQQLYHGKGKGKSKGKGESKGENKVESKSKSKSAGRRGRKWVFRAWAKSKKSILKEVEDEL